MLLKRDSLGEPLAQLPITSSQDVVVSRFIMRQQAGVVGFSNQDIMRISTAVSELARNIVQHSKSSGKISLYQCSDNDKSGIIVCAEDSGVGIADPQSILSQSKTIMSGGLYGTQKFADAFDVSSSLGRGTTVVFKKWVR